jgi:hypothetical protein
MSRGICCPHHRRCHHVTTLAAGNRRARAPVVAGILVDANGWMWVLLVVPWELFMNPACHKGTRRSITATSNAHTCMKRMDGMKLSKTRTPVPCESHAVEPCVNPGACRSPAGCCRSRSRSPARHSDRRRRSRTRSRSPRAARARDTRRRSRSRSPRKSGRGQRRSSRDRSGSPRRHARDVQRSSRSRSPRKGSGSKRRVSRSRSPGGPIKPRRHHHDSRSASPHQRGDDKGDVGQVPVMSSSVGSQALHRTAWSCSAASADSRMHCLFNV